MFKNLFNNDSLNGAYADGSFTKKGPGRGRRQGKTDPQKAAARKLRSAGR